MLERDVLAGVSADVLVDVCPTGEAVPHSALHVPLDYHLVMYHTNNRQSKNSINDKLTL